MRYLCLSLSTVLFAMGSYAGEHALFPDAEDEEWVSIATGYEKPISKAPSVATVITADDLEKMGITDLDQALETVPGLHVSVNPITYSPIYTFRGIFSEFNPQVLMLVNGVPITNVYLGNRNLVWGGMPVEAISRIEIIRGPGSAVYGADAFAGVINVITKDGEDVDGVMSGVRYGSFGSVNAWTQIGGQTDNLNYMFSLEFEDTDGQDSMIDADGQTFLDLITGTTASLAPGPVNVGRESYEARLDLSSGFWRFQTGLQRREIQTGAGVAQALDPTALSFSDRKNVSLSYSNDTLLQGDLTFEASGSYLSATQEVKNNIILFPAGSTGPNFNPITGDPLFVDSEGNILTYPEGMIGNPEVFEKHYRFDVSALYRGFQKHEVRVGIGYYQADMHRVNEVKNFGVDPADPLGPGGVPNLIVPGSPIIDVTDTPFAFITEGDRDNKYLFVQDAWQLDNDWELTAGVRYDDYSDFGSTVNPRLALVWSTSHNLTTKVLYGQAFRAPSFAETRNINNPVVLGNPDLAPEELESYELAFDYRPTYDLHIDANLFYYRWDDIILFVPDAGGTTRTAQNAGEQTGYGVELNAVWDASDTLKLSGNLSVIDTTDERTNTDAGNAPETQLYFRADWQFEEQWSVNLQTNWVMDRQRVAVDTRPDIDDYLVVDSKLRYAPSESNWELALIVKNLFDEDAREPSPPGDVMASIPNDLPLAGRAVMGELRFRLDN